MVKQKYTLRSIDYTMSLFIKQKPSQMKQSVKNNVFVHLRLKLPNFKALTVFYALICKILELTNDALCFYRVVLNC